MSVELNAVYGTNCKTAIIRAPLLLLSELELNVCDFTVMTLMMAVSSRILPLDGLTPNKSNVGSHCKVFLGRLVYVLKQGLTG